MVSNIHDATLSSNTFFFFSFLFFALSTNPESVASLLNDQYVSVFCPSLETQFEVPLTAELD